VSPAVDGTEQVDPETERRAARIEWLAGSHGAGTLARMVVDTEARVADLEREQLAREVSALRSSTSATPYRDAVIEGYRRAVVERDALRRDALVASLSPPSRLDVELGTVLHAVEVATEGLRELVRAGRAGELSMRGLVPVTALVELLDRMGAPIMAGGSYRPGAGNGAGTAPEDPPVPPDGAR
jgi:hypothetical protein